MDRNKKTYWRLKELLLTEGDWDEFKDVLQTEMDYFDFPVDYMPEPKWGTLLESSFFPSYKAGDFSVFKLLLSLGADVNKPGSGGNTTLIDVCRFAESSKMPKQLVDMVLASYLYTQIP